MSQRATRQPRLIVANLDCEADFAAAADLQRVRPRPTTSRAARAAAAEAGTLLRAFAEPGDVLLLPAPIDPARLVDLPGLPRPALADAWPARRSERPSAVLAWGETERVARLRARGGEDPGRAAGFEGPLYRAVWQLPVPSPAAAAAANGKSLALATAVALGCALPGARMVASAAELETALDTPALAGGPFVLKAGHSAAGRWRYVHREPSRPLPRRRVARLLAAHGPLLLEPWYERDLDVGTVALLGPAGLRPLGRHRQRVDREGRFLALDLPLQEVPGTSEKVPGTSTKVPGTSEKAPDVPDDPGKIGGDVPGELLGARGDIPASSPEVGLQKVPGTSREGDGENMPGTCDGDELEVAERQALERALVAAAEALRRLGYVGPFGIDAWRYRRPDGGGTAFHPLGEINARMSFGLVARALVERLRDPLGFAHGSRIALRFGRALPAGSTTVPLLRPAGPGSRAIWLEPTG